jgi:predicted signal transduction protein with EAL and GGDEF domain
VLLQAVADRIRACVRPTDTIARLGGDEFAIVQTESDQPVGSTALAARLIKEISAPYEILGHQVIIGASIGISVAPDDGADADQLLKNADMALYRSKEDGRGAYRFFEAAMDAKMQTRRKLELDLRKAVVFGEFELFYQPSIDVQANKLMGLEALIRWRHPERGLVSPSEFIPLAEEIGLIVPLGEWALRKACIDAASWPSDVKIAVNLSPVQVANQSLVPVVVTALAAAGLAACRLEIEITESVLMHSTAKTMATLHQLRELGVHISMDDFGTGYSSLSYLRKFPFDKIKIDRSFVSGLPDDAEAVAIVRAVAGLAQNLDMTATAEGVETAQQLDAVRELGCVEMQGYVFSQPLALQQIAALLEPQRHKLAKSA